MNKLLASAIKRANRFLADPGLSQIALMRRRILFYWMVISAFTILMLTILTWLMHIEILTLFGLVLLVYYLIILPLIKKRRFELYNFLFLAVTILTAFVFILIMGGFMYSAGLIFVGLTCAASSVLLDSQWKSITLFGLYVLTIILMAILNPYLTPHPSITPENNFLFFIINTLWISGVQMIFIIFYIRERSRYENMETDRLREIDEVKSKLFTNFTHEFRTPLTLILGMADQIPHKDPKTVDSIRLIKKHSRKILNLVNQILDLTKIDSNLMKTHYISADVIEFLKYSLEAYHSSAYSKQIRISFYTSLDSLVMDFDPEKLEGIVGNLISNAIKFTPSGGDITVHVDRVANEKTDDIPGDECLKILIEDTGIGIPEEAIPMIFDRYYQLDDSSAGHTEGSGIGLTIVKEFVRLMQGDIEVCSEPGKGTQFRVLLPITQKYAETSYQYESEKEDGAELAEDIKETDSGLPLVLVVEDSEDVMNYLMSLLSKKFRIIKAGNGEIGHEKALEYIPDIIISDVMMPVMDGFELLKKLKTDFRTSHIPVILLTARADTRSRLEGLESGAEAYLVKPFNQAELFIRIDKLLELRKILQNRYQNFDLPEGGEAKFIKLEDKFINKVHAVLDLHLGDELFSIKELCRELAMSHTQLYRKFSALTHTSVNKYIRRYRLHKAMELLKMSEMNVTQVGMEVGFSNPAYFSRIFTEEFGVNPSKVIK